MASWQKTESWAAAELDEEQLKRLETKSCPSCGREYEGFFVQCPSDQMALSPVPVPKGTIAKKFACGRKIGMGSLFDLYEGKDEKGNPSVIIKALRREFQCEQRDLKRFEQEQMIASALKHESISTPLAFGALPEQYTLRPFIIFERINGLSLAQALQQWGRCDMETASGLIAQICAAFEHAHALGALHSDFKPSNVLLAGNGKQGQLKIIDFGVSKRLFPGKESTRYGATASAQSATSALYSAPELAKGASVSAASDIYAIGCVLYELLSGKPPFDGTSAFDLAYKHERDEPASLADDIATAAVREAIMACLAKEPAARADAIDKIKSAITPTQVAPKEAPASPVKGSKKSAAGSKGK